jgi:Polyketide cyclase / dehydrase and lipid transport
VIEEQCSMNFTDVPRYYLRKSSLIDVAFFDSAKAHESMETQKLCGQELWLVRPLGCKWTSPAIAIFVIAICMGFGSAFAQTAVSVSDDAAKRSSEIHWPSGFSPDDADLFAHNEIFIKAPASAVWRHLVEAQKWPEWYPNSQDVQIVNDSSGVLKADSKFQWSTFGLHITSTIHEFLPNSRLGWFGKGTGVDAVFYHTWLLIPTPDGCRVVTEEVAKEPGAVAFRKSDPNAMHRGHELWLDGLKLLSEK